jgi:AraC-like DNA-binding protein
VLPLAFIVMICMLQDRRRPLWPVAVMMIPFVVLIVASMVDSSNAYITMIRIYYILFAVGMAIYMVRAVRQYGRWLRDNYADLENKEVWQSIVVLAAILLTLTIYTSGSGGMAYEYIVQLCGIVLTYYLLWRVETLSDLSAQAEKPIQTASQTEEQLTVTPSDAPTDTATDTLSDTHSDIEELLQKFCVDTQLYLEHDLSVSQLAQTIGTNRTYLSQYFSSQQTTYNSYINTLRINHFVNIYREAVAAGQPFTVQLLSARSGYHSYSTFSLAFKQRMGQSVSAWIRQQAESAADV